MQPQYPVQPTVPQHPQQPQGYPTQPAYPQQPFPVQPAYPPQGYAQPQYGQPQYAPQQQQAPMPSVGLDDYWQQPSSGGGPSLKFKDAIGNPQIGKAYEGFIARPITDADVRPQTNNAGVVQTYRDGRVKSVMVVPLVVPPTQEFPDGQAGWWVKGQCRDELARAMAEAGAPAGAPEAGAFVRITLVSVRPIPNMNPAFQYRVDYTRPQGSTPTPHAPAQAPAPAPVPVAPVMSTATGQPAVYQQPVPPPVQQPVPVAAQPVQQAAPVPVPPAPAPGAAPTPSGFTPEQRALFAKLTGQPTS